MLTTFLDKLSSFLDRRFVIAYWMPAFVGSGLAAGLIVIWLGWKAIITWWTGLSTFEQATFGLVALLAVTLLAYLLQALTTPIVRLYEGYNWPDWLAAWAVADQRHKRQKLRGGDTPDPLTPSEQRERALQRLHRASPDRVLYYNFPRSARLLLPTRLGNTLVAAEEYPYTLYGLDSVVWWPRLTSVLPDSFRAEVDAALTPMLALINLSLLIYLVALGGGLFVWAIGAGLGWFGLVFLGGLILGWACYQGAISQAGGYGEVVRVAFDFYRHEILKKLHIRVPDNLLEERLLWESLNHWIYLYMPPWETPRPADAPVVETNPTAAPFFYDTHTTSSPPTPEQFEVTIKGSPSVNLTRKDGV